MSVRNLDQLVYCKGSRQSSGKTLASHLRDQSSNPSLTSCGKAGSCLPLVGSLQYRTWTNCMCWFPLPFQLSTATQNVTDKVLSVM